MIERTVNEWENLWEKVEFVEQGNLTKSKSESLRKTLIHLYAWHVLFLDWYRAGLKGKTVKLPAAGYTWRDTPRLNKQLDQKYRSIDLTSAKRRLKLSHSRVMKVVADMPEKEVLTPSVFAWTGKLSLASYWWPNTGSHYKWAATKLKKLSKSQD